MQDGTIHSAPADRAAGGADRGWIALIAGYYLFHALWRRLIGGNLNLDEAQILLDAQTLRLGYGPQPPLYAWLQWAVLRVVGDPLLAIALLKNALLAGTALAVYALLRQAHAPRTAGPATLGLLLLPQIAWESQRALTHSVLGTTLAAVALLVFWTRVRTGRPQGWLLLGVVAGLGGLAKLNHLFAIAAILIAAAATPSLRPRLRPAGLALAAGAAAAVVALPTAWMARNRDAALASFDKFDRAAEPGLAVVAAGAAQVATAALTFVALAVAATLVLGTGFRDPSRRPVADPLRGFLARTCGAGLAVVLVVVVASGTTTVSERWLQPVLYPAGPALVLWLLARVTPRGRRAYLSLVAAIAALVVLALPVDQLVGTPGGPARGGAPLAELAPRLRAAHPDVTAVIADPEWLAGNLLLHVPDWQPARAGAAAEGSVPLQGALLVWSKGGPDALEGLVADLEARTGQALDAGPVERHAAAYRFRPRQTFVLHAVRLRPAAAAPGG